MVTLQVNLPDMYCCMFFDTKNFYNTTNHNSQHTTHLSATYSIKFCHHHSLSHQFRFHHSHCSPHPTDGVSMSFQPIFVPCHIWTSTAALSPVLIDDNIDSQITANKPSVIVTAPVALPPAQNQQLLQQLYHSGPRKLCQFIILCQSSLSTNQQYVAQQLPFQCLSSCNNK